MSYSGPLTRVSRWTAAAIALCLLGAVLRLSHLSMMEFKEDEQEALTLGIRLLDAHPLSNPAGWPTHGQISSNGVGNAPLFTWLIAGAWVVAPDPVRVAQLIALANAIGLYPLWCWARRRMDERRALLTLAIAAVSPFAVIFSRKIWTQDLLFSGVIVLLWGLEWWRAGRRWRGLTLLALAVLLVGQLHQSGLIAMALLPFAMAWQARVDRRAGLERRPLGRPSVAEALGLALVVALNVCFWLPYVRYLREVPAETWASRPVVHTWVMFTVPLLRKILQQVVPVDLFFFEPDRGAFLAQPVRVAIFGASVSLGVPVLVYGLWRWLRSPRAVPVLGVWWWGIIAVFTAARIHCYPFYVLALAPVTALLPAGAFDAADQPPFVARWLPLWRWASVASLFGLTLVTGNWLLDRGGSEGDYGVLYAIRQAQAVRSLEVLEGAGRKDGSGPHEVRDDEAVGLSCGLTPPMVPWIARTLDPAHRDVRGFIGVCDNWVPEGRDRVYRWKVRDQPPQADAPSARDAPASASPGR